MATDKELSDFLASIERRAFKQAIYAVKKEEAALDIVQDAMLKLAEKYGDKSVSEYPMLFCRILQNTINDYFRRENVRNSRIRLFSSLSDAAERDDFDVLDVLDGEEEGGWAESAERQMERTQLIGIIEKALGNLPSRQRDAFLMRYLYDMDVAETAAALQCSEGTVKTHCSRAVHTLAKILKAKGIGQ
ncbi:MAG: RNA polymerase sigma factor [Burkholderiaceae bacterium]|jgi:RNA polymerase sigma-70 factor (ECF subfamily)|nr:RNA polymerase sigma factor [Burkholderiaceae bacterium]